MKGVILILSVCAFAAAFVPRDTQEDQLPTTQQAATTTTKPKVICAPETPCGWAIYNSANKYITSIIDNTYCECETDLSCEISEDDKVVYAFVKRCRPPRASAEDKAEDAES